MKYLEKIWARGLISFILGGVVPEIVFISTGDPNRPRSNYWDLFTVAMVVFIFIFLNNYVKNNKRNSL